MDRHRRRIGERNLVVVVLVDILGLLLLLWRRLKNDQAREREKEERTSTIQEELGRGGEIVEWSGGDYTKCLEN